MLAHALNAQLAIIHHHVQLAQLAIINLAQIPSLVLFALLLFLTARLAQLILSAIVALQVTLETSVKFAWMDIMNRIQALLLVHNVHLRYLTVMLVQVAQHVPLV